MPEPTEAEIDAGTKAAADAFYGGIEDMVPRELVVSILVGARSVPAEPDTSKTDPGLAIALYEAAMGWATPGERGMLMRAADRLRELREDVTEYDLLVVKLTDLLTRTANALKGEPDDLTWHDWSDLPEVAGRLLALRDAMRFPKSDCPSAKRKYDTERDALDAKKLVTRKLKVHGGALPRQVYDCPLCDGWHLSSQRPRQKTA